MSHLVAGTCVLLAIGPIAFLRHVRRNRPAGPGAVSYPRVTAVYVATVAVLWAGAWVDGLPAALGLLGTMFALMGLGLGVTPLYGFLYGPAWLGQHPGVVDRDVARWGQLALLAAVACLAAGLLIALLAADVAVAPG